MNRKFYANVLRHYFNLMKIAVLKFVVRIYSIEYAWSGVFEMFSTNIGQKN